MPTRVRSHAKINLGLGIGAPRDDGFHGLSTVYQTLEMHDIVTVAAERAPATALRLTSNDSRVPCNDKNTAWKMVALALEALNVTASVEIHLEKHLPVQGGLGAGSANAVAALIGLERELGVSPQPNDLGAPGPSHLGTWEGNVGSQPTYAMRRLDLAAQVGSDVPLFLIGGTVLGVDRGQKVSPLPDLEPIWTVIVAPEVGVSTPRAFRDWDAICLAEGLTREASADKLNRLSRAYQSAFSAEAEQAGPGSSGVFSLGEDRAGSARSELVRTGITNWIQNDFERVVFPQSPSLAEIKLLLAATDTPEAALHASLSGSGSALFGLYKSRGDAERALDRLKRQNLAARTTLTQTLPRADYWRQMILD
jgi:4-diphosphocytidyl-2-C-methyl-D-erythritol kinase